MKTGEVESARLVAEYAHRHRIKPGMTGWAAINGSRGPLNAPDEVQRRVALDVDYIARQSFWLDLRIMPPDILDQMEAQTHRRIVKTHLPVDALTFSPKAKYLYIGRDGRDVLFSLYNHHLSGNEMFYDLPNNTPDRVGPPLERPDPDINRYFRTWVDQDGRPFWPFFENIRSWWAVRDLPNVKLVHFADLKADLEGQMRAIADFLDCDIPQDRWPRIVEHCSFDWMKANAPKVAPLGGAIFNGGAGDFIHKGVNGRWRDVLTARESADYETRAVAELGEDCARWLASGQL
jgi:aryl sulfotransferase